MHFEKYYSINGKEFYGFLINHEGKYLAPDWSWTAFKVHAHIITNDEAGIKLVEHAWDNKDELLDKLKNLKPLDRALILMRYQEGLTFHEIAGLLVMDVLDVIGRYQYLVKHLQPVKPVKLFTLEEENAIWDACRYGFLPENKGRIIKRDEIFDILYKTLNWTV